MFKFAKYGFLAVVALASSAWAENFNIKYSSNYLMPAYVNFSTSGNTYSVQAKINVPLYKIVFSSKGTANNGQFHMLSYRDTRNGKTYAMSEIDSNTIQYGKVKDGAPKKEPIGLPTFDLFTMAFQLSYYEKLPTNFQITNGKKLYPMQNVVINKSQKAVNKDGQTVQEITYKFKTGNKDVMVKKWANEKFPRFISYNRDGDNYELEFDSFVK